MRARRVTALLLALFALGAGLAAAQAGPAPVRVLLAVRAAAGGEPLAAELAETCRAGLEREGLAVLPTQRPAAAPADLLAEAVRRGAAFVVEAAVSGGAEIVIEATLTSVPGGERVAAVKLTGPADLGLDRKGLRIAQELGGRIRSLPVAAPAPASAPPAAPAEAPAAAAAPPVAAAAAPAPAVPSATGGLEPAPPEVLQERALMEQARSRLKRDLEESQRARKRATVRAYVAWGVGALALAGAGVAWWLADRTYREYQDAQEADAAASLREESTRYTWIAIGTGALGGLSVAGGTIFWLTRPDGAPIERALDRLDQGQPAE